MTFSNSPLASRLRLVFSLSVVLILLGGFAQAFESPEPKPIQMAQLVDSTNLSVAMVHAEDSISDLNRRLEALEKANLKDEINEVQQRVESMYFILKTVAGAIFAMAAKDLFVVILNFFKSKTPTP